MKPVFIAEIGINHGGSMSKAARMITMAKEAGADIAKFQFYSPIDVLGLDHPALDEAIECQFKRDEHERLKDHCDRLNIEYCVSIFDTRDILWADSLVKRHKIATRMNLNLEFLAHIERTKKPVIMSIQPETTLRSCYRDRFYFMWCPPGYPSDKKVTLTYPFSYKYGLSSHCSDYTASVEAAKKGARIFENHVKESDNDKGCDMSSSINFSDYAKMIGEIRENMD
jgi:N,N'-diacetyllegionaminate synthase